MTNPTCSPAAALPADSRRETEKAKGRKGDGGRHTKWCETTCNLYSNQQNDFYLEKKDFKTPTQALFEPRCRVDNDIQEAV